MEGKKSCFIIMPFSKSSRKHSRKYWTNHFQEFLKKKIKALGNIEVKRSEELRGDIVKDIIISLYNSDIVIADITDYNPNVFWELGVRLSLRSGTITIAEEGTEIPFDLSTKKVLFYSRKTGSPINETFFEDLEKAIKDCIENPEKSDSIVSDSLKLHKMTSVEDTDKETIDEDSKIENTILRLNRLFQRLYDSKGVINMAFATELMNDKDFKEYIGTSPGNRYGSSLGDHEIYLLAGEYYIIPNSVTLRKRDETGNYIDVLTHNSEEPEFREAMEIFNRDIRKYIESHD